MKQVLSLSALVLAVAIAPAQAMEINIAYSEVFQEKLEDDYGEREGERLSEFVANSLNKAFERRGADASRVVVTIEDARPNRPTFKQLGDEPGLDFGRSIAIGGADFTGIAYNAAGEVVAEIEYDWFENDIREVIGAATWTDAQRASRRFADRMARTVAAK